MRNNSSAKGTRSLMAAGSSSNESKRFLVLRVTAVFAAGTLAAVLGCACTQQGPGESGAPNIAAPSASVQSSDDGEKASAGGEGTSSSLAGDRAEQKEELVSPVVKTTGLLKYFNLEEAYGGFMTQVDVSELDKKMVEALSNRGSNPDSFVQCYQETEVSKEGEVIAYCSSPIMIDYYKITYDPDAQAGKRIRLERLEKKDIPVFSLDNTGYGKGFAS